MKKISLLLFILLFSVPVFLFGEKVSGVIVDQNKEPLPYASIYIKGTTTGTTSNYEGFFMLNLKKGDYTLVFQYVGFKKLIRYISVEDEPVTLNIELEPDKIILNEVIISATAEDPAYAIIRKTIEKKKYYLKQVDNYTCKVYTKGIFRIAEAPDKMFGDSLNTINDSILGIVYLSESESKIHFQQPDKIKEEMISSKVSGNDQGFSINFVSFFLMSFYKNIIHLPIDRSQRGFISPVSSNAFFYYKYRLEGTFQEDKYLINKIKIIPKRKIDPVFSGYIYIVENLWRIHSIDVTINKEAQIDFIDSVKISQSLVPVNDTVWMTFSQKFQFYFSMNFFGKKFGGNGLFHSQHTNYKFNNKFSDDFFKQEIIKIEEDANKKDSLYWELNRPIPLTNEENRNYKKQDSLEIVRNSKEYLDSLDRKNNKFKINNLLFGYSYNNRYDSTRYWYGDPLTSLQFNTVQGFNLRFKFGYFKNLRKKKYFSVAPKIGYGFSDKKWLYTLKSKYYYNPEKFAFLTVEGGKDFIQFNPNDPISPLINSLYTLLDENNFMKIYEKDYINIRQGQELINGIFSFFGLEYSNRKPLVNTTSYTWVSTSREYTSNDPQYPDNPEPSFTENQALIFSATLRLRFKQKYISIPDKVIIGSKFPDLYISYQKGIYGFVGSDVNFDLLKFNIRDRIRMGLLGESRYSATYGFFPNNRKMEFMDYKHFNANKTIYANNNFEAFQLLDYYSYSTNKNFFEVHYEHHFNGFIINKLPLIRRTKWKAVGGVHFLSNNINSDYLEVSVGIKNIFKVARIDFITSFSSNKKLCSGFVFRLALGGNDDGGNVTIEVK
ncbi:MAG: DUF5686 and carboxypeptidase regulatory-like domain-containing protein [Bacteroidales bacterium]|nr:DUF5686 and carboxypeptidase regulatory-like domain-containing protein [Bacteroidales bacterium]